MKTSYAVGVDFGTESGRAVLVEVATGREIASAVHEYSNGVIDTTLPAPDHDIVLGADWALQDPSDYLAVLQNAIPEVLRLSAVDPAAVIGLGIDFTACTMLPTTRDGTPLCLLAEYRRNPHAWVKLWKHHAAQAQADRINAIARDLEVAWLPEYGGRISSEWFYAKALQILEEAPDIYESAQRLIEAADWVVWQLTGVETRNSCTAGYKAIWSKAEGFPDRQFFAALHPGLADIVDEKMSRAIRPLGDRAGVLTDQAAAWTGLRAGTAVAIANVDAHVSVPAATVTTPGRMVAVMGTSICHLVLGDTVRHVEGMCGVVEDGIIPGLFGFEAGQSAVGDIFSWFADNAVPPAIHAEAAERQSSVLDVLELHAARLGPGESGLLALDWWNGNRSVLVDVDLTGLLLGATLATTAAEIFRALMEATAFGTRMIIESFESGGVVVNDIVACGGLPERNRTLMQIFADVTGKTIHVASSGQTPALGSAMFGAVAAGASAGGYDNITDAARQMAHLKPGAFVPDPEAGSIYDDLYTEYRKLHDYFGRGANDAMKHLKAVRSSVAAVEASLATHP